MRSHRFSPKGDIDTRVRGFPVFVMRSPPGLMLDLRMTLLCGSFQSFSCARWRRILHRMAQDDTFTLTGDYENRVLEALKVAQHQARLAQAGAAPRMQDALVGLEDALSDQIAWLENAAEDDKADAEERGDAERERQSWRPLRAA